MVVFARRIQQHATNLSHINKTLKMDYFQRKLPRIHDFLLLGKSQIQMSFPIPQKSIGLLEEAARMARLNHPNIVRIMAVSKLRFGFFCFVLEAWGSLILMCLFHFSITVVQIVLIVKLHSISTNHRNGVSEFNSYQNFCI